MKFYVNEQTDLQRKDKHDFICTCIDLEHAKTQAKKRQMSKDSILIIFDKFDDILSIWNPNCFEQFGKKWIDSYIVSFSCCNFCNNRFE